MEAEVEGESTYDNTRAAILDLPPEVVSHIFAFAQPASLFSAERVCHSWREIASSEYAWKVRVLVIFKELLLDV